MSRRRLTVLGLLGAGLIAAGALAGCASGASSSPDPSTPVPDATDTAPTSEVGAAWLDAGRAIAVVTYGSSTCVPVVAGELRAADGTLTVDLADPQTDVCSRDMAPRATFVPLPAGVDASQALEVTVTGAAEGQARLAGLAGAPATSDDMAPSAGWAGASTVAIVTYGSSSCVPRVESATVDGTRIAVRFAAPPADQVCTMDYAPRVTLADVDGEVAEGEATVTLSGGGVADAGPVPVLGTR
ncbi:hypothetical protein Q9R20_07890 [Microbacterium sp. PRF11]|uniref:hypothetical protein n=1 Tax=Microbacterium sp. PRF11 TaxID=2962593 RepID=UPI00288232B7|nr:hypothetical protein [Microbacterium sp. PRF11]MDT0116911.1 hypothetical protein [Microbacterium sp. PRF11]